MSCTISSASVRGRRCARLSTPSSKSATLRQPGIFEPLEARQMLAVHAHVPAGGDIYATTMHVWSNRPDLADRDLVVHLAGGANYTVDLGHGGRGNLRLGTSTLDVRSFTLTADEGDAGAFANVRLLDAGEKGDPNVTFDGFYNAYKDSSNSQAVSAMNSIPFGSTSWIDIAYAGTGSGQKNINVHIEGVDVGFAHTLADGTVIDGREVNLDLRPTLARPPRPSSTVPSEDPQWTRYNMWNWFYQRVQLDGNLVYHRGIGTLNIVNSRITGGGKNIVAEGFSRWLNGDGSSVEEVRVPLVRLNRVISRDAHRWNADRIDFGGFHAAGIYLAQIDRIELLDSVFSHNGWKRNASGSVPVEYAANGWSHGAYIQSDNTYGNALIRNSTFVDNASEGLQLRSGGTVEDSLFVGNANGGFFTRGSLSRTAFFEQIDLGRTGNLNAADKGAGWMVNANDPPRSGPMTLTGNVFGWKAGGAPWHGPINNNVNHSYVSYSNNFAWSYGSKESYSNDSNFVYLGPGLTWLPADPASRSDYPNGGMRAAVARSVLRGRADYTPTDSAASISTYYRLAAGGEDNGGGSGGGGGGGTTGFNEVDGRVDIEAETFQGSAAGTGIASSSSWTTISDTSAGGSLGLQASPNSGVNAQDQLIGPRRDYTVNFTNPGTYYVWVRVKGVNGSDDSLHVGLNGAGASLGSQGLHDESNQWVWVNRLKTGARVSVNVAQPGVHTFNLWMREDGVRADAFLLTSDPNFDPANPGGGGGGTGGGGGGSGGGAFNETGGKAEFEVEAFTGSAAGTGIASGSTWTTISDAAAGGGTALEATPNVGVNAKEELIGPRRDYSINFTTPGTYYVWIRLKGPGGSDKSVHVGLNGLGVSFGSLGMGDQSGQWTWVNRMKNEARVTMNVAAAGTYNFNLWMREDGVFADSIVLTQDPNYDPANSGGGGTGGGGGGGGSGFNEVNGRVDVEAETFTGESAGTGSATGSTWTIFDDALASGSSALSADPNRGVNTGDATDGPRRDYAINFTNTGTYYVWVRMSGGSNRDDSLHIGVNGQLQTAGGGVSLGGKQRNGQYHWINTAPGGVRLAINVAAPGQQTLNLWMLEDGTKVDKFILTKDVLFNPTA